MAILVKRMAFGLLAFVAIILVILFVYLYSLPPTVSKLRVINNSSSVIRRGEVDLCGQTSNILDLNPGKHTDLEFVVKGECHYKITIHLENDRSLSVQDGYVTTDAETNALVRINDDNIEYEQLK